MRIKRNRIIYYLVVLILLAVLITALFVSNIVNRKVLSVILIIFSLICRTFIKKKKSFSYHKDQVFYLMLGFSIIYMVVFYLMGLYFGFYKSPTPFCLNTIFNYIIPLCIIIFTTEYIRKKIVIQKGKILWTLLFICMVLIDIIVYIGVYNLNNLDDFLAVIGFIIFASMSCNLLYNYITIRYGSKPVIVYRLITTLYVYCIPLIPNIYIFFRSFLRMLYPYLIYVVLEYTYSKTNLATAYKDRKKNFTANTVTIIIMTILIMLISCRFRYGLLVIGSGSMTGSIDKGDVIFFEKYKHQDLEIGQVIVFNKDGVDTVHRIVDIETVNREYHLITKGDANQKIDDGYIKVSDIKGLTYFKIKYIGYPTIWVRDIFK